jgi:uncharacterized membrane protein
MDSALTAITGAMTEFSAGNVVKIITAGLAISIPLVLLWFGFRWIYRKVKGATKGGKG